MTVGSGTGRGSADGAPLPSPDLTAVGANVLRLVSTWPLWVKRRVETIDFLDEATIRRSVRVDLDLSEHLADDLRVDWKGLLLVPIAALHRRPHATFVIDEQDAMLPRLNKFEEREVCHAAMHGWAEQLASRARVPLPPGFGTQLRSVIFDAHTRRAAQGLLGQEDVGCRTLLYAENGAFRAALEDLTENFYLLAPLRVDTAARRVLRYCYFETLKPEQGDLRLSRRFLDWVQLTDTRYVIDVPSAGDCQSFHFEVNAPWDLTFAKAEINVTRGGRHIEPDPPQPDDDWHPGKAHIFLAIGQAISKGEAIVVMRPMPTGVVRASYLSVLLISGVLVAGTILLVLDRVGAASTDFHSSPASLTLLLMLPVAAAAYLSRPAEHRLTAKLLFNVRISLVVAAIMPFLVAATIGLGWNDDSMLLLWPPATAVALACAARLGAQFFRARRGMQDLRVAVTQAHPTTDVRSMPAEIRAGA